MISLNQVTKEYPGKIAVDELTFEVEDGEFCVIIGPSGCGKSTTLRMINRLIPVSGGSITLDGKDIYNYRPEELRRQIGYAIQSVGLFPHMTVARNIGIVPQLMNWDMSRIRRRTDELLDLLNLDPGVYRDQYPRQLSGGEAQRVGVARALAADPAILLMDEPFGAIDPITRESLQTEFARIQKELKKTIVFVTHDIDEAIRIATRILVLKDGKLVQYDTPENIMTAPAGRFVTEFIGTDRALKRLSRLPAGNYMKNAPNIRDSDPLQSAAGLIAEHFYLWVLAHDGTVLGWLDENSLKSGEPTAGLAMTSLDFRMSAVDTDSTLKEALSRMVQQGIRSAPVVDMKGVLLGEIRMGDILEA
ncbi:MAG: ABC transporter ATP-binding protein [bacterium]|nr:ABC transporter ATP-binding protein [bacterium]MDT8364886.1 ABC transporter ATP-binding protein [bacterium]